MKAIITVGISGSGKTTWAESFVKENPDYAIICRDDIRFPDGDKDWTKYNFKKEKVVHQAWLAQIEFFAASKNNIIIADTSLNKERRYNLTQILVKLGYDVEIKVFDTPLDECIRRDNQRYGGVGESVIYKQWLQLNGQKYDKKDGIKAYIVDIDGTVAIKSPERGHYDWDKVGLDLPNSHVIDIVKGLHRQGYEIIFLSGRSSDCYEETSQWLLNNIGIDFWLFMRESGDMRRDSIVKKELFDNHVKEFYNIMAVIDDRPQVIKETWLPIGLNVVCVGNPYINF